MEQLQSNVQKHKRATSLVKSLGPAIITAALVVGPGSVTLTSKIGAMYGYSLLWVIVVSVLFMMCFTEMSARIGMATNQSLLTTIRVKWGRAASIIMGLGCFLVTSTFQGANVIGAGVALSSLAGGSPKVWGTLFTLLGIAILFYRNFYKILEKLMLVLVGIMLFSFLCTVVVIRPSFSGIFSGLVPQIPDGSAILIIGLVATTFTVVGALYQSYLVQEKGWTAIHAKEGSRESYTGIILLGIISALIMISAAAVLNPQGIQVNAATDMGKALEPLFGNWAMIVFMIGLWGAAFSSLTGNAAIGGVMLADAFGYGSKLESNIVRYFIMAVMVLGGVVALVFGKIPVQLIMITQPITIVVVPLIGLALFLLANDKKIMGDLKNTPIKNGITILALLFLVVLAVKTVNDLFFS
ncbi:manganese transporter [Brevibacillus reuszeri]|uniref:Nramp family divalent metal transporter n=1 Tax=Brevibacillus reuszeri TaxID=54915 RepID=UPI001B16C206|nr:Nramp family divalent metal transporter [Brevibacillus reuszeri]GIO05914.1 manganese transporter [Brevibacillus reuszeri]